MNLANKGSPNSVFPESDKICDSYLLFYIPITLSPFFTTLLSHLWSNPPRTYVKSGS